MSAPNIPPFATAKFQPMYSPTSTMPTPRPQMCSGPRTFESARRSRGRPAPTAGAAGGSCLDVGHSVTSAGDGVGSNSSSVPSTEVVRNSSS